MDPILREFYLREIASLEAEIRRIKDAQRVMREVTKAVKAGELHGLSGLGFGRDHVRMLLVRHQHGKDVFPPTLRRGNRQMLRRLQEEIALLRQHLD